MGLLTKLFMGHAVVTGTNVYSQLGNASLAKNLEKMLVTPWGHTLPVFVAEGTKRPELPYETHQVATALAEFGFLGADPGVCALGFRKVPNKGSRVADETAEHVRYTANNVVGYLSTISASNNSQASVAVRLALLADASTDAIVYSGTDVITETPTGAENFVLGPIAHDGTIIEGTNDMQINLNPKMFETAQDEHTTEPTFGAVDNITPDVSFVTTDLNIWSLDGTAISNSLRINLVRKQQTGDRYADGATQHIVFTMTQGLISCEEVTGPKGSTRVMISPIDDGANNILTYAVNSAVTTANPA